MLIFGWAKRLKLKIRVLPAVKINLQYHLAERPDLHFETRFRFAEGQLIVICSCCSLTNIRSQCVSPKYINTDTTLQDDLLHRTSKLSNDATATLQCTLKCCMVCVMTVPMIHNVIVLFMRTSVPHELMITITRSRLRCDRMITAQFLPARIACYFQTHGVQRRGHTKACKKFRHFNRTVNTRRNFFATRKLKKCDQSNYIQHRNKNVRSAEEAMALLLHRRRLLSPASRNHVISVFLNNNRTAAHSDSGKWKRKCNNNNNMWLPFVNDSGGLQFTASLGFAQHETDALRGLNPRSVLWHTLTN